MDLLWVIENQISENHRNEYLGGNLQIDRQMESKSCNLKIIDPESQRLTSDERWTVHGQTTN